MRFCVVEAWYWLSREEEGGVDMVRERCPRARESADPVTEITGDDCLLRDLSVSCSPLDAEELPPGEPSTSILLFAMLMLLAVGPNV